MADPFLAINGLAPRYWRERQTRPALPAPAAKPEVAASIADDERFVAVDRITPELRRRLQTARTEPKGRVAAAVALPISLGLSGLLWPGIVAGLAQLL